MNKRRILLLIAAALAVMGMAEGFILYRAARLRDRIDTAPAREVAQTARDHAGNLALVARAGRRLLKLGQAQAALSVLQAADRESKGAPAADRAVVEGLLAQAEVSEGQMDAGIATAQRSLSSNPTCAEANFAMGLWWERQARWHEAEEEFFPLTKANPRDAAAAYHLAVAVINQDGYARAAGILKSVVALAPINYDYWRLLAEADAYSGRFGDAAAAFERAFQLRPAGFEARANVARARAFAARSRKDLLQQEKAVNSLLPGDPDAVLDQEILGMVEIHAADTRAAQVHLQTAARIYRKSRPTLMTVSPELFVNLAFSQALNGENQHTAAELQEAAQTVLPFEKISELKQSLARQPNDPTLHLQLAQWYERYDSKPDAIGEYEDILRLNPADAFAHSRMVALSAGPEAPEDESAWAWRVLSTEIGMAFPHEQA